LTFEIAGNRMHVSEPFSGDSRGISVSLFNCPHAEGVIARNEIVMAPNSQGAAIDLANGRDELSVDVVGNKISGESYDAGISAFQFAPGGTLRTRVIGNVVIGQAGNVGQPGAIAASSSSGTLDIAILNNTVVGNEEGISMGGRADQNAVLTGVVANNIVARNSQFGIAIERDFNPTITNSHNLVFANDQNFFVPGPETIRKNPVFVSATDFHLGRLSPAIDRGDTSLLPATVTTDADGDPRVVGKAVDLGAFEFGIVLACDETVGVFCDDRDPCTQNSCVAGRCVYKPARGLEFASCACDLPEAGSCANEILPSTVESGAERGCKDVLRGRAAASPTKAERLLQLGADRWRRVADRLVPPVAAKVAAECAQDLSGILRDAADDVVKSFD